MGTDDSSKLGLAEKKQKSGKPACGVFALVCPIRAANAAVPTQSPGGFSVIPALKFVDPDGAASLPKIRDYSLHSRAKNLSDFPLCGRDAPHSMRRRVRA